MPRRPPPGAGDPRQPSRADAPARTSRENAQVGLREYNAKRDFERTPEPPGQASGTESGKSFVVQKHAASRLHYDFRLELDGVLLSWAVPKGPSLDPKARRLAVRTEDHPVEYGTFEGIIPKGEYGGGTVLLWDRGTWEPEGDPHEALTKGHLRFRLEGEKLSGAWHLVRTKGTDASWLLFKSKDDRARAGDDDALVKNEPRSVASGRTLEEIADDPDRVWHSGKGGASVPDASSIPGAKRRPLPRAISPELATLESAAPDGEEWLHELKYDGYRILARLDHKNVALLTRKQNDWTARMPQIARALSELPIEQAWLDGEVIVPGARGAGDFGALQNALGPGKDGPVRYVIFDLLYLDGYDLRGLPLLTRKEILRDLTKRLGATEGRLRYSDHVVGAGPQFFASACQLGLEGIISKRLDRPYVDRRARDWLKVKCGMREEAVIVGFSEPSGSRAGLGALLLAQNEGGELRYVGKVGTGFDTETLKTLRARLDEIEVDRAPLRGAPRARGLHWVKPELVAEISFQERTKDGKLRIPVFVGLREDKEPRAVRPERAGKVEIAGVVISNPDRVLWPETGVTKRELAEYYERVCERMLPHLSHRPLTLVRCPNGIGSQCFYQQHAFAGMPESIEDIEVTETDGVEHHMAVHDLAGLAALVQFGALEIHVWGARADQIERPDMLVIDLDPAEDVPWPRVVESAFEVRERLDDLGLTSFVKTTGGKGLHLVVPIQRRTDYDEVKEFTHALARDLTARAPDRFIATMTKSKRGGKIFVDYLRNGRGATAICPYSARRRPGAPVATPISWRELTDELSPSELNVRTVPERLRSRDPWSGFFALRQSITKAARSKLERAKRSR
jgi:bifunctional non-homologous end joining protein LigD